MSLLERLGGVATVTALSSELYDRMMVDDELGPLFADTHLPAQKEKLAAYLVEVCGGGSQVAAVNLRKAHAEHDVTDRHFSIMASHLVDILEEFGVDPDAAADLLDFVAAQRGDVVNDSRIARGDLLDDLDEPAI